MLPEEEKEVRGLFSRSLGIIDRVVFNLSFSEALKSSRENRGTTLVAEYDGKIVGSFSLRIQLISKKKVGFIDAIVVDRTLRGKNISKSLLDRALIYFKGQRCDTVYATADRYNSPSWNLFNHRGFFVYEFWEQLRDYGLNFIRLWNSEFYIVGFGTFFLKKDCGEEKLSKNIERGQVSHFLASWLIMAFIWCTLVIRNNWPLILVPSVIFIVFSSIFAHEFSHAFVAKLYGLSTTFRAWDSGLTFGLLMAILGTFFPAYGSTYIKQTDWRYNFRIRQMGLIYAVGPIISLILAALFLLFSMSSIDKLLASTIRVGYSINIAFTIFNLLPIKSAGGFAWDGRKVYDWSKIIWLLLVIGTASMILFNAFT